MNETPYYGVLKLMVLLLQPKYILELGTGRGRASANMMVTLPMTSNLITINLPNPPSGDNVGIELEPWKNDPRLHQILGDTREVRTQIAYGIDLLFIDSGEHSYAQVSHEWALYKSVLMEGAIVCMDDIDANDMPRFWEELPYAKLSLPSLSPFGFGIFRYSNDAI